MSLMSPTLPKGPIDFGPRLQALPGDGSEVPMMPGWTVLRTPGHTPGHCSFYRAEDDVLLVGDAFCTTKPESFFEAALAQHPELHGPPAYFTSDWQAAKSSVNDSPRSSPAWSHPATACRSPAATSPPHLGAMKLRRGWGHPAPGTGGFVAGAQRMRGAASGAGVGLRRTRMAVTMRSGSAKRMA